MTKTQIIELAEKISTLPSKYRTYILNEVGFFSNGFSKDQESKEDILAIKESIKKIEAGEKLLNESDFQKMLNKYR